MKIQTLGLSPPETRAYAGPIAPLGGPAPWQMLSGDRHTESGESVNSVTAMHSAVINACVTLISSSIASMSPLLYQRTDKGRSEAFDHPLHRILTLEPNADCSAFTLWDSFVAAVALTGNGYLEIVRNGAGEVAGLEFLHPLLTSAYRGPNGSLMYRTGDGLAAGQFRELPAKDVCHVLWHSTNSVTGVSVIEQARTVIGAGLAMDKFGARFFANYAMPQMALMTKKTVKPEDKMKMRSDWESLQTGHNQHRVAVLDQEMELKPLSIPPDQAQWLEAKNFSRQQICGLYRVHPSQIGDTARVSGETYSGQQLTFLNYCLRPWLNRIEQELTRKLLVGLPNLSISHNTGDLLKLDFETQMKGFAMGRQWGFYTANEVRRELGENPYPGPEADLLLSPVNMMDARELLQPSVQPTEAVMNE